MALTIKEDADVAKKETTRTVRLDDSLDRMAQDACASLDCSFSDLVRAAIMLSTPLLRECPPLLRRIAPDDFKAT